VVDEGINDVPVGEVDEIVYRAPTLMAGYSNNPEAVLAVHPAVVEVAVIRRRHQKWGEVPVAIVALRAVSDQPLSLADLVEFVTERLARYKHPKALGIVDALPHNPAGKVLKTELRA
jgi:fatty-acyl-CoA synthase